MSVVFTARFEPQDKTDFTVCRAGDNPSLGEYIGPPGLQSKGGETHGADIAEEWSEDVWLLVSRPGNMSPFVPVCVREAARTGRRRFIPSPCVVYIEPVKVHVLPVLLALSLSKWFVVATASRHP